MRSTCLLTGLVAVLAATHSNAQCSTMTAHEWRHHIFTFSRTRAGSPAGSYLSGVGDVDRDGCADVIVGSPADNRFGQDAGFAQVYSGQDGRAIAHLALSGFRRFGSRFGGAVDGIGDVDRDRHDDLVVGSWGWNRLQGAVEVYSGKSGARLWSRTGTQAGDVFGESVAGGGDLNGDGRPDVLVGATQRNGPSIVGSGFVRGYSGDSGAEINRFVGTQRAVATFGCSVDFLTDVDGDRKDEVLVGACQERHGNNDRAGAAYLYLSRSSRPVVFTGGQASVYFGWQVAGIGDFNGDRVADFAISGFGFARNAGIVRVYSGARGHVLLWQWVGAVGDEVGRSLSKAGDLDGDGTGDIIVGARPPGKPGYALVITKSGRSVVRLTGRCAGELFAIRVKDAGDVNGDGSPDVMIGAPNRGLGVAQVWSVKPLSLVADRHEVSRAAGSVQSMRLDLGTNAAGRPYWLWGSAGGAKPGSSIGGTTVPLNGLPSDPYFSLALSLANSPLLPGCLGTLDARGTALCRFVAVPSLPREAVGVRLHHAAVVLGTNALAATAAAPVTLTR